MVIVMDYVELSSWWTRMTGNKWLRLKEENKLIYSTTLRVSRNNIRITHKCIILVQKAARRHAQTQGIPSVLGCVFLSIFMVRIVVYLAELPWFLIHAFHGLERARPRAMGLDTSNSHTNTHKYAQTHTHIQNIHNRRLLRSGGRRKRAFL